MIALTSENIIRVHNGDLIVKGDPGEIEKKNYEEAWLIVGNLRDTEQLEVEKSGLVNYLSPGINVKKKLSYYQFIDDNWYIL
jgi:hypothetical protein